MISCDALRGESVGLVDSADASANPLQDHVLRKEWALTIQGKLLIFSSQLRNGAQRMKPEHSTRIKVMARHEVAQSKVTYLDQQLSCCISFSKIEIF